LVKSEFNVNEFMFDYIKIKSDSYNLILFESLKSKLILNVQWPNYHLIVSKTKIDSFNVEKLKILASARCTIFDKTCDYDKSILKN